MLQWRLILGVLLIAVLAGLNRLYFTTFQFKRTQRFIDEMDIKPDRLAQRIEALFAGPAAFDRPQLHRDVQLVHVLDVARLEVVDVAVGDLIGIKICQQPRQFAIHVRIAGGKFFGEQ